MVFVFSTADQKVCRRTRDKAVAKIRAGLEQVAATVRRGHPATTPASIERRVAKLLGQRGAAQYFRWELVASLPTPALAISKN